LHHLVTNCHRDGYVTRSQMAAAAAGGVCAAAVGGEAVSSGEVGGRGTGAPPTTLPQAAMRAAVVARRLAAGSSGRGVTGTPPTAPPQAAMRAAMVAQQLAARGSRNGAMGAPPTTPPQAALRVAAVARRSVAGGLGLGGGEVAPERRARLWAQLVPRLLPALASLSIRSWRPWLVLLEWRRWVTLGSTLFRRRRRGTQSHTMRSAQTWPSTRWWNVAPCSDRALGTGFFSSFFLCAGGSAARWPASLFIFFFLVWRWMGLSACTSIGQWKLFSARTLSPIQHRDAIQKFEIGWNRIGTDMTNFPIYANACYRNPLARSCSAADGAVTSPPGAFFGCCPTPALPLYLNRSAVVVRCSSLKAYRMELGRTSRRQAAGRLRLTWIVFGTVTKIRHSRNCLGGRTWLRTLRYVLFYEMRPVLNYSQSHEFEISGSATEAGEDRIAWKHVGCLSRMADSASSLAVGWLLQGARAPPVATAAQSSSVIAAATSGDHRQAGRPTPDVCTFVSACR